jgi:hypothetical protein
MTQLKGSSCNIQAGRITINPSEQAEKLGKISKVKETKKAVQGAAP